MADSEIPDFPDAEVCIAALLRPLVAFDNHIGNFVIEDYDEQVDDKDELYIELHERGGRIDMSRFTAWPMIEVMCWGKSRTVAQDGMKQVVRKLLLDNRAGHFMAGGAFFDSVEDVTGSTEEPSDNPDDRCVSRTFQLECRPMYD